MLRAVLYLVSWLVRRQAVTRMNPDPPTPGKPYCRPIETIDAALETQRVRRKYALGGINDEHRNISAAHRRITTNRQAVAACDEAIQGLLDERLVRMGLDVVDEADDLVSQ